MDYKNCCNQCHWMGLDKDKMLLGCYVSGERQELIKNSNIHDDCSNFYDYIKAVDDGCNVPTPWD